MGDLQVSGLARPAVGARAADGGGTLSAEVGSAWEKRGFYAVPTGVNGGSELLIFVRQVAHCRDRTRRGN